MVEVAFDEPVFTSSRQALVFAYRFTHGTMKRPFLASLMGGPKKPGRGLAGLDGAAQAGLIKAEVGKLGPLRRFILTARYAPQTVVCECKSSCCMGYTLNPEWAEAVEWLTDHALRAGLVGTISHYRLRRALVVRFFGDDVSMVKVAQHCNVHRDTVSDHYKRVSTHFGGEERVAQGEIDGALHVAGVVGS